MDYDTRFRFTKGSLSVAFVVFPLALILGSVCIAVKPLAVFVSISPFATIRLVGCKQSEGSFAVGPAMSEAAFIVEDPGLFAYAAAFFAIAAQTLRTAQKRPEAPARKAYQQ